MLTLSYNISPKINNSLDSIEALRKRILTFPLSSKIELQMRWEAKVSRIYWSVSISGNTIKRRQAAELLSTLIPNIKKLSVDEKEVLRYKNALDYINYSWTVTEEKLKTSDILELYTFLIAQTKKIDMPVTAKEELTRVLDYLEVSTEHPVIKAAILQMAIRSLSPFPNYNGMLSRLAGYLMLCKNGYDVRQMLVLDEYWKKENEKYKENIKKIEGATLTFWIEFFCEAMESVLNKTIQALYAQRTLHLLPDTFWSLNDRQKQILSYLTNPNNKISNREVQKRFKVSQITASRDLVKMQKLGLLVSRSRGRSTHYTKA